MKEQHGFTNAQTGQGQQVIQRKTLAPGLGEYYQQPQPPRSNPHRAGHYAGLHSEDDPHLANYELEEGEEYYLTRPHTSARRYTNTPTRIRKGDTQYTVMHGTPPARHTPHSSNQRTTEDEQDEPKPRRRVHWLLIFGVGMVAMLALWTGLSMLVSWWQTHQDDATYGRPRTFQRDAVVGHGDSASNPSHFIALNLNRHVVIIELPGGESAKAKIYSVTTLFGDGQDLTPVTLSFKDVNGDGLFDMEIHIQDQTIALINDQGGFRPLKQGEKIHV